MSAPPKRELHAADLRRKMVFVGGARQVGKTHLDRTLRPAPKAYLNWDVGEHRQAILRRELPPAREIFFDEIHKYRGWRGFLKGLYDAAPGPQSAVVYALIRETHDSGGVPAMR